MMKRWLRLASVAGAVAVLLAPWRAVAEKQPEPWVKLSLSKLGFPGVSANFLSVGASMLTVNLLDDTHLLVTFGSRSLVPRLKGDPETHDDRMVAAELVELPMGKVLAKTEWHLHDHARYLWSLGNGRALVRIGDSLWTMAPLANLASGNAFRLRQFADRPGLVSLVNVSPDGGVVTVETQVGIPGAVVTFGDPTAGQQTLIDVYRISGEGSEASPMVATLAKAVKSPRPLLLPLNADGYLWATEGQPNHWAMTFDDFNGTTANLGLLDSSCDPRLQLVSKSQFVALSCRGTDDKLQLAAYGFDGHETWEEPFGGFNTLMFAFAPEAGRFAMSRTTDAITTGEMATNVSPQKQEVRVYQTESGDLLLHTLCSPVFKTAENFDMSADGHVVAVVRDGDVVVYQLRAPSARDRKEMAEAAKFTPPAAEKAAIDFPRIVVKRQPGEILAKDVPEVAPPTETPIASAMPVQTEPATTGAEGRAVSTEAGGDEQTRKKPTLLNPGEKAEYTDKKPKS